VTSEEPGVVEQTVRIAASPETVWRYWTEPDRIREWWGTPAELDVRPGGSYLVEMAEDQAGMRGEYVELVPTQRLVFTFGWEGAGERPSVAPGSTRVEVTLVADDGDTIVTVRHTLLPADHVDGHRAGWQRVLPLLARAAGAGNR
jgi:uncharacterized protein YndB with AHSA1/START domain